MSPSDILDQSRRSAIRLRRIDDDIAMLQSRVGGQGNGFGTSIDHNVILDQTRHMDDLIMAEEEFAYEVALCKEDIHAAETLIAGSEALIVSTGMSNGMPPEVAHKNANDMCYAMRAYYVEACSMSELCERTGYDARTNDAMLRYCREWVDHMGTAHLKGTIRYDDRTPEELAAIYGPKN